MPKKTLEWLPTIILNAVGLTPNMIPIYR